MKRTIRVAWPMLGDFFWEQLVANNAQTDDESQIKEHKCLDEINRATCQRKFILSHSFFFLPACSIVSCRRARIRTGGRGCILNGVWTVRDKT